MSGGLRRWADRARDRCDSRRRFGGGATWPTRAAAVVALLAPVAMAIVAAVALAGDLAIAALAVVLALLANVAIWLALTDRGRRAGARRGACAARRARSDRGLGDHWHGLLVLVGLLLLLAVFGFTARYALGRTGEAAVSAALPRSCR